MSGMRLRPERRLGVRWSGRHLGTCGLLVICSIGVIQASPQVPECIGGVCGGGRCVRRVGVLVMLEASVGWSGTELSDLTFMSGAAAHVPL